jgi:hypothetical protein
MRLRSALHILLILIALACTREVLAAETNLPPAAKLSVTNLLAHKSEYKGKRVEVTGYYLSYFECNKLSQHQGDSDESSIWVHLWRVKPGHEKQIKTVTKGQVRVTGTFDFKDTGSGHLGMWAAEITDLELFEPL